MSDRLYFSVPDECDNMLAQRFLRDKCGLSARIITRLKREKDGILMDGKILRTIDCVQSGKTVSIAIPDEKCEIEPTKGTLDIRYEDEHFLVVNKPHSMPVHPVKQHQSDTLANIVSYYCSQNGKPFVFRAINRLDKDTSGLLVVAKTPDAKTSLGLQFYNKTTKREYNALVWGIVEQDEGTITGNIGRNPRDRMQMAVMSDPEQGKHAVTHYQVLERLGYVTLVKCVLETGRTHQIRVHMKHIGHTLFNDERYGGHEILKGTHFSKYKQFVNNCFEICPRQALHAKTLGFVHPRTGEEMFFTSELPEDMTCLLERWRTYISNRE